MKVKKVLAVMMAGTMAMGIAVCSDAGLGTVKAADDASASILVSW